MCTNEILAAVRVKIVVNLLHACYTACNIIVVVVVINTGSCCRLTRYRYCRSATILIPVEHMARIS